jgi:type IV pilus assembly protein PilC
MAQFQYEGRDVKGKRKAGRVTSESQREAILKLREKGIKVKEIKDVKAGFLQKEINFGNPVKSKDFVIFLRQFSTLLEAGVPIVQATKILAEQTASKELKKSLVAIQGDINTGQPLSEATSKYSKIFPTLFVNMVKVGEVTGNLDETLNDLADYYEKQNATRSKLQAALVYPALIAVFATGVIIFLLVSVVPTFVGMFAQFGAELPALTQTVLTASAWMTSYWWIIIVGILILIVAVSALAQKKEAKYYIHFTLLKLPVVGSLLKKAAIARMTRTLSSLVGNSVPILQAISISEKIVGNEIIAQVLRQSREALESGKSLTEPLQNHWVFPSLVTQMISIGEETGSLEVMLGKVADFYELELENATEQMKALIEPIIIASLAVVVGVIVLAIIMPMFAIFEHIK